MKKYIFIVLTIIALTVYGADKILQGNFINLYESGGSDRIKIVTPSIGSSWTMTLPTSAGTSGYVLSTNGSGTTSWVNSLNSFTFVTPNLGTPSAVTLTNGTGLPLSTGVTGTLPIANGGTGQTTANDALNALLPSQGGNSGKFLQTDGTNSSWQTSVASVGIGGTVTSGTTGSVLFVGAGPVLSQDNAGLYYDTTNKRLGIGLASPSYVFHSYNATSNVNYVSGDASVASYIARASTDASTPDLIFRKARNTTASPNAVSSGDINGRFLFQAHGGANWRNISAIQSAVDSYTSDTQIGGRLQFFTSPSSAASATERMRITQAGDVGINNTSPGAKLDVSSEIRVTASGGATGQLLSDSTDFYVGPTGAHNLRLQSNGATRVTVDSNGNVTFTGIHNNGSPPTNTTQTVSSGTYTPTLTNSTNVAASSNATAIYSRVGNVVTVSGSLEIDPTSATTNTLIGISLPIASNFVSGTDAFGMATMAPSNVDPADGWMTADTTNDRMTLQMYPNVITNQEWRFHFQYVVK